MKTTDTVWEEVLRGSLLIPSNSFLLNSRLNCHWGETIAWSGYNTRYLHMAMTQLGLFNDEIYSNITIPLSRVERSTILSASSGTFDWHIWWILAKSWRHFSCMMVSSLVSLPSIQKHAMIVKFLVFYRKKILRTWLVLEYWVWVCVTTQYTETYHRIFFYLVFTHVDYGVFLKVLFCC